MVAVQTPTLILQGDDDAMFPLPHAEAVASLLPNSTLEVLAGRGHEIVSDPAIAARAATFISSAG